MQAASSPYLPPPQPYYQGLYHIQPLGSHQDHELKRQYLALLSPQQIIDICLAFDVHVSPYVKSTIWPQDLNAAIAGLRKSTVGGNEGGDGSTATASSSSLRKDENDSTMQEPIMASLDRPPEGSGGHGERMEEERSREKQVEENVSGTSTTTTVVAVSTDGSTQASKTSTSSTVAPTSTSATPAPTSSTPVPPTVSQQPQPQPQPQPPQQPPYPHQPYGYPQHAAAAYPHAPYYQPPPGYPSYPPSSYPHYPQPLPNGYPTPSGGYTLPPNPYSTPATAAAAAAAAHQQSSSLHYPHLHPHPHQDQASDDLPSYEEMIVEALQESGSTDPEGCAPRDLFSWMAVRYPLQSNFRPSASQALQKAFKRGRLEKSSSGKYRLNVTWEGGSTSRRTTRRPQSQSNAPPPPSSSSSSHLQPPPSGSPFTHAPLVHHHHHHANSQHQQQHNAHNSGYPYAYGYPGYLQHPTQHQQHQHQQPTSSSTNNSATKSTTGDKMATTMMNDSDRDAYEAAQNILKAINFGDLLQISQNEDGNDNDVNNKKSTSSTLGGGGDGGEVSMDQLTSLLMQAQQAMAGAGQSSSSLLAASSSSSVVAASAVTPLPTLSATAGVAVASTSTLTSSSHGNGGGGIGGGGLSLLMGVNVRAELQAQLALLAVQLAELGQDGENGVGVGGAGNGVVGQLLQSQNGMVGASQAEDGGRREQQRQVDVGGSMTVLNGEGSSMSLPPPPPMNGLLPLSLGSNSGLASTKVVGSLESQNTPSQELQGRQEDENDDIPIDPVLRDACAVPVVGNSTSSGTPPITMTTTEESAQSLPAVSEKRTGSEPTDSTATMAVSAASTTLTVDQGQEQPRSEDAVPSMMMGDDDDDESDDDDMEEII